VASAMSVKLGKREYLVRKTRPPVVSDPAEVLQVLGLTPDDWQTEYLASDADVRMLFSTRQAGKTEISAVCAVLACATTPELYATRPRSWLAGRTGSFASYRMPG